MASEQHLDGLSAINGWSVYVAAEDGGDFSKVGTSVRLDNRIVQLQNGNPRQLNIVASWHLNTRRDAMRLEQYVLARMGHLRLYNRDWIKCHHALLVGSVNDVIKKYRFVARPSRTLASYDGADIGAWA